MLQAFKRDPSLFVPITIISLLLIRILLYPGTFQ